MLDQRHIDAFTDMLGAKGTTIDQEAIYPHVREWRDKFIGKAPILLMPSSTEDVRNIVRYCDEHHIAIVPQGGNTGLVGGGIAGLEGRNEVILSTKRLNKHISVDAEDFSVTVDAGVTVSAIQSAAAEHGLLFPLSLASEGSCTAGGIVSTNAGGVHVIRYGTTRALTLGLEAVLPNGEVFSDLSSLRKDNTGYALNQLLIGAEGTLGVITRITFKLYPAEMQKHTFWLGVNTPQDALSLFSSARTASGDRVSVFEILPHTGLEFVLEHIEGTQNPLDTACNWYVLMEVATSAADKLLTESMDDWVAKAFEQGLIKDGAVAQSETQTSAFWKLRESMSEAQKYVGGSIKHDISVPVSKIPAFIEEATALLAEHFPSCRPTPFGHLGDGNLHFNVMQPEGADKAEYLANWEEMNRLIHDLTIKYGGSISAEHGIGTLKREELARTKSNTALSMMKAIKQAIDPKGIMNPGSLF
ncbi:FAD-binding oxidoreductase [Kordiimonas laminariae]|uniref:FAD-binding oxidoreductase n=1 Tax=Kordiimonas laminariae TaxID=2917717 RepID=UPI001FF342CA|nr:FAD-binding oxidoreductase [Kordiimonas laminariae]MCK0069715.1 FAD-binding oxidoreductase [Kordiimonas laminariae]